MTKDFYKYFSYGIGDDQLDSDRSVISVINGRKVRCEIRTRFVPVRLNRSRASKIAAMRVSA
jgi:hypothetical protein